MSNADLEARITRLEDIEAIKQLKVRYAHICDDLHNPETINSVFAEDGVWESADFGTARGHAEIKELFSKFRPMFTLSQHNMVNPLIEVDGDRATGVWYILGPWNPADGSPQWFFLRYDDEYVKVDGEWKFKRLSFTTRLAEDRFVGA